MPAVDPNTGRPIWAGPNGEAASADPGAFAKLGYSPDKVQSVEWDGRTHYYVPGFSVDKNRAQVFNQNAPGAGDTLAGDGGAWKDPAGGGSTSDPSFIPPGAQFNPDAPDAYNPNAPWFMPAPYQAPEPAPFDPGTDPTFLAFQRALTANEDNLRASIARKVAAARQAVQDQMPTLQERLKRQKQDVNMGHAAQGTWSSSQRLNDENQAQNDYDMSANSLNSTLAQQEAAYNGDLNDQLASDQRSLADQLTAALSRGRTNQANADAAGQSAFGASEGARYREWLKNQLAQGKSGQIPQY